MTPLTLMEVRRMSYEHDARKYKRFQFDMLYKRLEFAPKSELRRLCVKLAWAYRRSSRHYKSLAV